MVVWPCGEGGVMVVDRVSKMMRISKKAVHVILLSLLALICALPLGADNLIRGHNRYSATYEGDWGALPTGKELAAWEESALKLQAVNGKAVQRVIRNQPLVEVRGLRLRVAWDGTYNKMKNTLMAFYGCERVIIEDCVIHFADEDSRASAAFFANDCGSVEIRNVRIAGAAAAGGGALIRLEGVESYFIDRVEIAGVDYGSGFRGAAGIFINNGQSWDETKKMPSIKYSGPGYRSLRWGVIQNCYFHDYDKKCVPGDANHDAVLIQSCANGAAFNNYFENWCADSTLDVSHRRGDDDYGRGNVFLVERNIFRNSKRGKNPGSSDKTHANHIVWANNVFINTMHYEYHHDHDLWLVHNSFYYNQDYAKYTEDTILGIRPRRDARYHFINNLVVTDAPLTSVVSINASSDMSEFVNYFFRNNLYCIAEYKLWVNDRTKKTEAVNTWRDWQASGRDAQSITAGRGEIQFVSEKSDRLMIKPGSAAAGQARELAGTGFPEVIALTRDFNGKKRPAKAALGAFEP